MADIWKTREDKLLLKKIQGAVSQVYRFSLSGQENGVVPQKVRCYF